MPATRTLIVDDSELARRGIRAILAGSPLFEIVGEASDGRQHRQGIARAPAAAVTASRWPPALLSPGLAR